MDNTADQTLKITSYNCRGVMSNCLYVDQLLSCCHILCLQEHHLFDNNKHFISTINQQFDHYTKCDSYIREDGLRVRQGGVSILWSKNISGLVKPLDIGSNNIQGVEITNRDGSSIVVLNVYLPSANHGIDLFADAISMLSDACQYYTSFTRVIVCGDFNSNVIHGSRSLISRNSDPRRSRLMNTFTLNANLSSTVTCDICRGTRETFLPYDGSPGSQIDHILIDNSEFINNVRKAIVHDDNALNSSDHNPVSVHLRAYIPAYQIQSRSLYRWDKADKSLFAASLDHAVIERGLNDITIQNEQHIDDLCAYLITCLSDVSVAVVPKSQYCSYRKPYWNDQLKQLHSEQLNLRRQWISEGKHRGSTFPLYVQYKQAKRLFAKQLHKYAEDYEQSQFHDISVSGDMDMKLFWKYIRRNRKEQTVITPIINEGVLYDTPEKQLRLWTHHFQDILNETDNESHMYDNDFKNHIEIDIFNMKSNMNKYDEPTNVDLSPFTNQEIQIICDSLPLGKAPGKDSICYEHFKYAGSVFINLLTKLFNGILQYVHIPLSFKEGLLVNLYKGHGKPRNNKNSYRGITLLPTISKLYEKCVMARMVPFLNKIDFPPPLQIASRKGMNNVMASFAVNEAIYSVTERNGKVFSCLMDIEKCFDRIWWSGLMWKMNQIGINNKLWHLLYDWMIGTSCCVYLNGQISESFNVSRSIKQGGIMSMLNLCIFMNDVHQFVDPDLKLGIRCHDLYLGSLSYADDLILMSNTKHGLDNMMKNAYEFARRWRFSFSLSKTKCIVFGESKRKNAINQQSRRFYLGDNVIEEVTHYNHLGVILCAYDSSTERTHEMCAKGERIMASLNSSGARPNGLYPHVVARLWNIIVCPSMLHGCEMWHDMSKNELDQLERSQSRIFRRIQDLPVRTHNVISRGLLGELSMASRIALIKLGFLQRLVATKPNTIVKQIFTRRLYENVINSKMKGFVPDIMMILQQYNLSNELFCYMRGGHFPSKSAWKAMTRFSVIKLDVENSRNVLCFKNDNARCVRVLFSGDALEMHVFHRMIKRSRNMLNVKPLITSLSLLALPETSYTTTRCRLCNKEYTDIVCHIIAQCPRLIEERNILWEFIIDSVDVNTSVHLFHLEDKSFVDWLLGGHSALSGREDIQIVYPELSQLIYRLFHKHFKLNYNWLK
jgi:endonuclease/exonuclease/phosphatase family metal-dependent hydrolase